MNTTQYDDGHSQVLRLGTRASLLAVAQSQQVADRLMHAHPGLKVELIKLQSLGDRDLQTPLAEVTESDFFSDELDKALAEGHVDFCVHSWKDIDGPRPRNFIRAAVPTRAMPHDVLLFRGDITELLRDGKTLRIGTSSQRRQRNTADFLQWALPLYGQCDNISFHNLRGPVHERAARIAADAGEQRLDGVVLALAGLERLWSDATGHQAIEAVLNDARWMVMPLSECPGAAAQGALAVETLRSNQRCIDLLTVLHDSQTEKLVQAEQRMLTEIADNHPGFGAAAVANSVLGFVGRLRGRTADNAAPVYATRTANETMITPAAERENARLWDGQSWRQATRKHVLPHAQIKSDAVFIAHADAYRRGVIGDSARCWTSGPESWAKLARQGLWVEGCADNLGFESVKALLQTAVLQLPELGHWTALTHEEAVTGWSDSGVGETVATYAIQIEIDPQNAANELQEYTHFYWASARQFALLKEHVPASAQHACGVGKTYRALRDAGLTNIHAFASRREWQQWLA